MFETVLGFTVLIFVISTITSIFGVLTGLGGGLLLIPLLTVLQIDLRDAMGVSLICIIALSLITATTKTNQALANTRVGMFLETGAVVGAIIGALLLPFLPTKWIAFIFGAVLVFIVFSTTKVINENEPSFYTMYYLDRSLQSKKKHTEQELNIIKKGKERSFLAWVAMLISGILAGLLGIGSGALKVLAMDRIMEIPYKVSTATSNFMVGMTAAAGVGVYFFNDYIKFNIIFPAVLGVYLGTFIGAKFLELLSTHILRRLFNGVILILAVQMFYKAWNG